MPAMAQAQPYRPDSYGRVMGALLKGYKATLSPAFVACGIHCRHLPTCSEYCAECVSRHGAWAGSWMTLTTTRSVRTVRLPVFTAAGRVAAWVEK